MKKLELTIRQRLWAASLYTAVFIFLLIHLNGSINFLYDNDNPYNLLFVSGALLLVFGTYITEPFFTRPVDTITNSVAVILALFTIQNNAQFIGYNFILVSAFLLLVLGIVTVIFGQEPHNKYIRIIYDLITTLGRSKVVFSVIYLATICTYFAGEDKKTEFVLLVSFWVIFIAIHAAEYLVVWISKRLSSFRRGNLLGEPLGEAIGCENPYLYTVEVDYSKYRPKSGLRGRLVCLSAEENQAIVGVIANEKSLLNKRWLTIYLLEKNGKPLGYNFKNDTFYAADMIYSRTRSVYYFEIESLNTDRVDEIKNNPIYKNANNIVGYVTTGSNVNKIRFETLPNSENKDVVVKDGSVVETLVNNKPCLYQIIDAVTQEESLEMHNSTGFTIGIAQKLGHYNLSKKELESIKWLPEIYSPVYMLSSKSKKDVDKTKIAVLPETELNILIKDVDALVTHNTAILGILGIGKSSLTFELIQKVANQTQAKIICVDITNEYGRALKEYLPIDSVMIDLEDSDKAELKQQSVRTGNDSRPSDWGNEALYKKKIGDRILAFSKDDTKKVLILNPDLHAVTKPATQFKIAETVDLSVAQKTRDITERIFMLAKELWEQTPDEQLSPKAKFWVVYEEAHSLIPEWNSSANDGDQQAANGTAKVILQGRKYGLGSLVITQRTANISKSILNQSNTIFALRVFDDTGKQFLENYIGSDYANTLSTLEERHAVIVGKALQLKQPIIARLNDSSDVKMPIDREDA